MRFLMTSFLIFLFAWCAGLVWFVASMPDAPTPATVKTDAIVVLTGGNGRVERGFDMLAEGAAPTLFISGVGTKVTLPQMLAAHASEQTRSAIRSNGATILLGREASTTRTNAEEATVFARSHHAYSLRLVTAHYHMARSLLEFRHALPDVTLIPDPVFPDGFRRDEWWRHANTRRLMLSEYHKYLAAFFRMIL